MVFSVILQLNNVVSTEKKKTKKVRVQNYKGFIKGYVYP